MFKSMKLEAGAAQAAFGAQSSAAGALSELPGAVQRLLHVWSRARRHRQAIAELRQLDDRMLKDIGLDRGGIYKAVQNGRDQI